MRNCVIREHRRAGILSFSEGNILRDHLFISHAFPEDNMFSQWLTLRLAGEGYPVWCDLVKLRGGENFWNDIEAAIRTRTAKFLYVLSKHSNDRPGTIQELQLAWNLARAEKLSDFIIPLAVDDLKHENSTLLLQPKLSIRFAAGWAEGLDQLLKKLSDDNVPKNPAFSPTAVSQWWRERFSAEAGVTPTVDECVSNWFPITQFPESVYFHEPRRAAMLTEDHLDTLHYPVLPLNGRLISLSPADQIGGNIQIRRTADFRFQDCFEGIVDERYIHDLLPEI